MVVTENGKQHMMKDFPPSRLDSSLAHYESTIKQSI